MSSINDLSKEIAKQLAKYSSEVKKELQQATDDVTKSAVSELKTTSPKKTGDYAKGWTRKKVEGGFIIHNNKKPQLTHLLERGHASASGGRPIAGKAHIRPAEEKAINEFTDRIERAVRQ